MSTSEADVRSQYPTTHWSQILLASQEDRAAGQGALDRLLRQYRRPLLTHLRAKFRANDEQAEDWLHDFVARKVLKNRLLEHADRKRGRFRTFLLNALDNFVIEEHRRTGRACRSPSGGFVPLDELTGAESGMATGEAADPADHAWAIEVLAEAEKRTRAFYEAKGRGSSWTVFDEGYVRPLVDGTKRPSNADLARRHGFTSAEAVSDAITTVRRMFGKNIRAAVREYEDAEDGGDCEAEIRDLKAILARSP